MTSYKYPNLTLWQKAAFFCSERDDAGLKGTKAGKKEGLTDSRCSPNIAIKALCTVGNPADWSPPLMRVVPVVTVLITKDTL